MYSYTEKKNTYKGLIKTTVGVSTKVAKNLDVVMLGQNSLGLTKD